MKKFFDTNSRLLAILFVCLCSTLFNRAAAQTNIPAVTMDKGVKDSLVLAWLEDLYDEGARLSGDSLTLGKEAIRLLTDAGYRQTIYPATYTWPVAVELIKRQDLKQAFWHLLNLYMTNEKSKDAVLKTFLTYDKLFKMDKILSNTFFTYMLADPQIGNFDKGQFTVTAPHIMEKKLNAVKEIMLVLDRYRKKG